MQSRIDFPPLNREEALGYVSGLIAAYQSEDLSEPLFPFSEESAIDIILALSGATTSLSPRKLNIVFDAVANEILNKRFQEVSSRMDDHEMFTAMEVTVAMRRVLPTLSDSLGVAQ